jgi:hypothetical protein
MTDDTTPTAPTVPTVTPHVEPHTHSGLSDAEAAKMIEWEKDNLAKGKITPEEATKRFDALGATPEQRAPDTRSDDVKQLDAHFPPAKESDYTIRYYTPGQEPPVMPTEVQAFDANARGWMADAGLSRELGNSLVTSLSKAIQHTHTMTVNERETYKDNENAKLDKLFGPDWHDQLEPAKRMIHELDQKRPGLKEFVRAHGDNALFVAQLIQAARIYDARKGR